MRDTDPKIVQEIVDEHDQPWHRCVICKMQWKPRTPAVHHDRCAIGNLQTMVKRHIEATASERRRVAELVVDNEGLVRRNRELGKWRSWAHGLVGRISMYGSDASLRFRIEDKIGSGHSAIERGLLQRIAALEEKLAEALDRDREFDATRREVTEARGKGGT